MPTRNSSVVALGASAGGLDALTRIVGDLPGVQDPAEAEFPGMPRNAFVADHSYVVLHEHQLLFRGRIGHAFGAERRLSKQSQSLILANDSFAVHWRGF